MVWQDVVLTAGSIAFIIALAPSILSKDKPALATSLLTGTVLAIYAIVYVTLSLWLTAITVAFTSLTWFILAYQKHTMKKL
jgi:hypothetical protein